MEDSELARESLRKQVALQFERSFTGDTVEAIVEMILGARMDMAEEIASKHSLYPGAITIMCSCGKAFNHVAFVAAEEWKAHIRGIAALERQLSGKEPHAKSS